MEIALSKRRYTNMRLPSAVSTIDVGPPSPERGMWVDASGTKLPSRSSDVRKGTILFEPSAATKRVCPSGENARPCGSATLRSLTPGGDGTTS